MKKTCHKTFEIHVPTAEQYLHQVNIMLLELELRMLLYLFSENYRACQNYYLNYNSEGKTGRTLTTRLREHQTATDKEDLANNIAQHHRKTGHDINWDSVTCLAHSTDKDQRLTLESWFTNLQPNQLNCSRKLPAAYERLLQSKYRTADENTD